MAAIRVFYKTREVDMFGCQLRRVSRALIILVMLAWPRPVPAQTATGSIDGVVVDTSGAIVPGVTVVVTHEPTAVSREVVTDGQGLFHAPLLPVGPYTVKAALPGFQPFQQTGIQLTIGQTASLRIELKPASVSESVTVSVPISAYTPSVETTRSQMSSTISEVSVANLPVNGRNFIDFALLTPGVTRDVRTGDISFAGQRGTLNSLVVDGADNNNTFFGQTLGRTGSGRAPYQFSQDAVQEFQVNSNAYSAEYGRAGGAVINVVTKSGTNTPHGSLFEFYRDKALNANNAINVLQQPRRSRRITTTSSAAATAARSRRTGTSSSSTTTASGTRSRTTCSSRCRRARTLDADGRRASPSCTPLGQSYTRGQNQDVFLVKTDSQLTSDRPADAPLQPPELHRRELRERRAAERARAHRRLRREDPHVQRACSRARAGSTMLQRSARPVGARPGARVREQRQPRGDRSAGRLDRPDHRPQQLQPARDHDQARTGRRHDDLVPRRAFRQRRRRPAVRSDPQLLPGQLRGAYTFNSLSSFELGTPSASGERYVQAFAGDGHDRRDDAPEHQRVQLLRAGRMARAPTT